MKKRIAFLGIGVVVVLGGAAVYMFQQMGKPMYIFGSVRKAEDLRGPLTPPTQTDPLQWRVESDIFLHFDRHGSGRPVLIVHGGPGMPFVNAWKGLKSLEDKFTFFYYHQRGAGVSTRPIDSFESSNYMANMEKLDKTLGVGAQVADIERIRQILKQDKLLLLGHSFGGFIAALYAAEFPEKVDKLILVAPANTLTPPEDGKDLFDMALENIPEAEHAEYNSIKKEYFNFRTIFSKSDAELVDLHTRMGRYLLIGMGYKPSYIDGVPTPGGWSSFAVYFSTGRLPDYRQAISQITAPTLVLQGDDDHISLSGSQKYAELIPNARFVSIGCSDTSSIAGHFIYDDCPNEFIEATRDFLDD